MIYSEFINRIKIMFKEGLTLNAWLIILIGILILYILLRLKLYRTMLYGLYGFLGGCMLSIFAGIVLLIGVTDQFAVVFMGMSVFIIGLAISILGSIVGAIIGFRRDKRKLD